MQKAQYEYRMLIPETSVMIIKTLFMNLGKTRVPSMTTKPSTALATLKPTSASGNLHAESKT